VVLTLPAWASQSGQRVPELVFAERLLVKDPSSCGPRVPVASNEVVACPTYPKTCIIQRVMNDCMAFNERGLK
jgi:hypothetical protein